MHHSKTATASAMAVLYYLDSFKIEGYRVSRTGTTRAGDILYSTGYVPFVSLLEFTACIRVVRACGGWLANGVCLKFWQTFPRTILSCRVRPCVVRVRPCVVRVRPCVVRVSACVCV